MRPVWCSDMFGVYMRKREVSEMILDYRWQNFKMYFHSGGKYLGKSKVHNRDRKEDSRRIWSFWLLCPEYTSNQHICQPDKHKTICWVHLTNFLLPSTTCQVFNKNLCHTQRHGKKRTVWRDKVIIRTRLR